MVGTTVAIAVAIQQAMNQFSVIVAHQRRFNQNPE